MLFDGSRTLTFSLTAIAGGIENGRRVWKYKGMNLYQIEETEIGLNSNQLNKSEDFVYGWRKRNGYNDWVEKSKWV